MTEIREFMINIHKIKSFTENPLEGNLAGVIIHAEHLSDFEMQNIAKEVGASETAFIFPSKQSDFRIRWFTPNTEVGLCIHATIAALSILRNKNLLNSNTIRLETKNTELLCKMEKNNIFVKVSGYHPISNPSNYSDIFPMLPINTNQLITAPQIIKIFDDQELVLEVKSLNDLKNLNPSKEQYAQICSLLNVTGISIFTRETFDLKNQIHTREFAPLYGYLEDPLCGMAAGAIAAFINEKKVLRFEQGHFCGTKGIITVEPEAHGTFWIGGSCCILS